MKGVEKERMDRKYFEEMIGKKIFLITNFGKIITLNLETIDKCSLYGTDKFEEPVVVAFEDVRTAVPFSGAQ